MNQGCVGVNQSMSMLGCESGLWGVNQGCGV